MSDLLDWPSDAVIIVASIPERAQRAKMESVNHGVCRDCGREILFDGYTFARASRPELTHGRPVEFLCLEYCFQHYDFEQTTIRENHTPEFKAAHPG